MGAANKAWNSAWCFFYTGLRKPRPDQSSAGLISLDAVWLWSKCRLAFVRIDESFSPIALSTYIDARTQSKGFRLDHYNRATWGISWHIFLIWHCIPGNRTHRAK
jgi:hypothetical protein